MEAACGAGLQDQLRVYCATNRLNPVDEYPLERPVERVYFAPDTRGCTKRTGDFVLFSLFILSVLPFVGQDTAPQALGSPYTRTQAFQLDNLAVIHKNIDFGTIILDIPGKDLRVGGLEHHLLHP